MRFLSNLLALAALVVAVLVIRSDIFAEQQGSCDAIVNELNEAIETCELMNEGWACYGNEDVLAAPEEFRFYKPGDTRPMEKLTLLKTTTDIGAALMYFNSLGEDGLVTLIVYGGAELSEDARGFILTMSDSGEICEKSPPGVVALTSSGEKGTITVNGVDIELGSVAFLTMADPDTLIVANIRGSVTATVAGEPPRPITKDTQLEVGGISDGQPVFAPELVPSPYATSAVIAFLAEALGQVYDPNTDPDSQIPACGGTIRIGQSVLDKIHAPGQECLYTFCPNPKDKVTISVEAVGQSPLDPYVDLRASDLTFVAGNNDRSRSDEDSLICNWPVSPTSCDQTIIVRSNRNESAGSFRLTLDGETNCTTPGCFCQVLAASGLNLRSGPGTQYPRVRRALQPGSIVEPLACTENREWYYVNVAESEVTGWFRADPNYVDCEPCLACNVPIPGISMSVSPSPSKSVESEGTVVFNLTVTNSGESSLTITSLSNNLLGTSSNKSPATDTCGDLINQPLAVGETKSCNVSVSGVGGDFISDVATATAEDTYGTEVGGNASATVKIVRILSCEAPEIKLLAEPSAYLIQNQCGVAEFDLTVINKSAEPITITSMMLDGAPIWQDDEFGKQCPWSQPLRSGETLLGCPLRVPMHGAVCGKNDEETTYQVTVTAKTIGCDTLTQNTIPVRVRFKPPTGPTPCPKCGPYGEP